ncbi:MAG: ATP-binding protein [Clostridia bacterium]|nr:ATP-binding protein [Clostridia bacterium]
MTELSLNILDIAENSVRAGASNILISLREDKTASTLLISVSDDGCGMDGETLKRVVDPFYTTRTTRKVGLGIPFFKMEAEQTGGYMNITSRVGEGTTTEALFHSDHTDFIPLGDVASTLVTLIGGSPERDFRLLHELKSDGAEKCIDFSTKEIRSVLGDVSLAEPEVLTWIREYLEEQYAELYGE